jgi:4-amino-4-deoxy-L-arabinose transferase-like glycosyltransferase
MLRRAALVIGLVALAHAALYIVYQQGEWQSPTAWTDQRGYQRLGAALATTGQFTRYADTDVFVPEVIRTPGYPMFVALIYKLFGVGNDMAVAIAQAFVFAAICWMVFHIARRAAGDRAGLIAAAMTALYSPLPYFGSLIVTELWTAFMATAAILMCLRAVQQERIRDYAIAGALFTATTMVRPAFVLMPFFFAIAVPILVREQRRAAALKGWAALAIIAAVALAPWFAYNYVNLGRVTLSPAGGVGRGTWEASWQFRWAGRTQAALTEIATTATSRDDMDARTRAIAAETDSDPTLMLDYVHEWRDIHDMWDTPQDPVERMRARIAADQAYLDAGWRHIKEDPGGHITRRLTRGAFILWAAEIPIRYTLINSTPRLVVRAIWLVQVGLLLLAAAGVVHLVRTGHRLEATLLALPLIYVTGVHLPLLCEARQSLPVKPLLLVLATIGAAAIAGRRTSRG